MDEFEQEAYASFEKSVDGGKEKPISIHLIDIS